MKNSGTANLGESWYHDHLEARAAAMHCIWATRVIAWRFLIHHPSWVSSAITSKKTHLLLLESVSRTAVSGHSRRDALCARRDGGGEGYNAGLEGESGDDEGLGDWCNATLSGIEMNNRALFASYPYVLIRENVYR